MVNPAAMEALTVYLRDIGIDEERIPPTVMGVLIGWSTAVKSPGWAGRTLTRIITDGQSSALPGPNIVDGMIHRLDGKS